MSTGRLITLEGIDGCGKTTVAHRLVSALEAQTGRRVLYTREPSDPDIRAQIQRVDDPIEQMCLFLLDRARHTRRIGEALNEGRWVVSDRYYDSTLAYNVWYPFDSPAWHHFYAVVRVLAHSLDPDLTIWLDVDPVVALDRIAFRGMPDRMADLELLRLARERYSLLHSRFGYRIVRVDASGPIDGVVAQCVDIILERFREDR